MYMISQISFGGKQSFERLLDNLPPFFKKASSPIPLFTIVDALSAEACFDTAQLRVKSAITEEFFDISGASLPASGTDIGSLKSALIAAGHTLSDVITTYDSLNCFTLAPKGEVANVVYYEQSLLRRVLAEISRVHLDVIADLQIGLNDSRCLLSESVWLDLWGRYFGQSRISQELDSTYLARIVAETLSRKVNNITIQKIINGYSQYSCFIYDGTSAGIFGVYFPGGSTAQGFIDYVRLNIDPIVQRNRAAGTHPRYYVPSSLLITNTAGNNTNDFGYITAPAAANAGSNLSIDEEGSAELPALVIPSTIPVGVWVEIAW